MPLKTVRTPELKGLYCNSNKFTVPKGSVPRVSNQYMIRRGALHTVPGTQWLCSYDGLAPHATNRAPFMALSWYSPSAGSSPAQFMAQFPAIGTGDYAVAIANLGGNTAAIEDISGTLNTLMTSLGVPFTGLTTIAQFGDYLVITFGPGTAPTIFPIYTQVALTVNAGDTTINVTDTTVFPKQGTLLIDSEYMTYTGFTPTAFTGVARGVFGTSAATHAIGAGVLQPAGLGGGVVYLAKAINNSQTTGIYTSKPLAGHQAPPTLGFALLNQEIISYTGIDVSAQLLGVARGTNGTAAVAHNQGTAVIPVTIPPQAITWGFITNQFDPSNIYGQWPGVADSSAATSAMPVDIGTLIYATDSNGTAWLFRAQNSGVTGFGSAYAGPNFFPNGAGQYGQSIRDFNNSNNSGTVVWLNVGQAALPPPGAAFAFQHLDSLWLWGVGAVYGSDGITGPDALWQSDIDAPQSFNPAYTTFVGKGDGTAAQGGAVYSLSEAGIAATPQLVLFKDASTYSFLNSFASNPALVPVSGGLGCIAPTSIQFIGGYGVMRLTYAGFALFDGQLEHVTEYTDAIRGYLFGGLPDVTPIDLAFVRGSVSLQSTNPTMYWCFCPLAFQAGVITRGFGYDFTLKQWTVIDLPFPISAAAFIPQASFIATQWQSIIGGLNDGTIRSMFFGAPDFDGAPIQSSVTFPEMGFPGTPVYLRRINLRLTADGGGATPKIVSATFTGTRRSGQSFTRALNIPQSILSSLDVGEKVLSGSLTLVMQGQVILEGIEAQVSELPTARVGL